MTDDTPIIVRPLGGELQGIRWVPEVGTATRDFLQRLENVIPESSRNDLRDSAVSILGRGITPNDGTAQETGLVVGYVQSGKTLSFEVLATLARDNGFQMIIIVAGISTTLLDQSTNRIREDLLIGRNDQYRNWFHIENPNISNTNVDTLRSIFECWRHQDIPIQFKQTVLISVLKHHSRLGDLIKLLQMLDMNEVPVLIIDDEADQASLNTEVAQDKESTTYQRLMELRSTLPIHNYIQYTATPQAPLLVNILDSLSPNFVEVLTPGNDYVGGRDFFTKNNKLVRIIPDGEVPTKSNPLQEPPDTLLNALRIFMLGVTAGLLKGGNRGNRSMLVHPSHQTTMQHEYYNWVRKIFREWQSILKLSDAENDKIEFIEELKLSYDDLSSTTGDELPAFSELYKNLNLAFLQTRYIEVNTREDRSTPKIDWSNAYGWILVGGQAIDRGFTVEGLTVTYMPRGIGVGNSDTVQQRARFFGYKRNYLGYCRVYLEQETQNAYMNYVSHEEQIRLELEKIRTQGLSLNNWKRAFFLDIDLKPCRKSVLKLDYMRGNISNSWISPQYVLASDETLENNRGIVNDFLSQIQHFQLDEGHPDRTDVQRHKIAGELLLRDVMDHLIIPMRVTNPRDSQQNTGLLLQLSHALDNDIDERCTIYQMSPKTGRKRTVRETGEVVNLYQGAAPVYPPERRGEVYPGDREVKDNNNVTVQIHIVDLIQDKDVVQKDVAVLAIWVPSRLGQDWIVQEQEV